MRQPLCGRPALGQENRALPRAASMTSLRSESVLGQADERALSRPVRLDRTAIMGGPEGGCCDDEHLFDLDRLSRVGRSRLRHDPDDEHDVGRAGGRHRLGAQRPRRMDSRDGPRDAREPRRRRRRGRGCRRSRGRLPHPRSRRRHASRGDERRHDRRQRESGASEQRMYDVAVRFDDGGYRVFPIPRLSAVPSR